MPSLRRVGWEPVPAPKAIARDNRDGLHLKVLAVAWGDGFWARRDDLR
jgi:hypothetical protein